MFLQRSYLYCSVSILLSQYSTFRHLEEIVGVTFCDSKAVAAAVPVFSLGLFKRFSPEIRVC